MFTIDSASPVPVFQQVQQRDVLVPVRVGTRHRDVIALERRQGDAADIARHDLPEFDYVLTSPPYWNMLHAAGAETQRKRRAQADLDVVYSDNPADLGNIDDYDLFLSQLVAIYRSVQERMRAGAYMTIIVKNVKKGGVIYPLAWDLAARLREVLVLKDERIWLQDNIRLAPYGMGNAWVSNTFHHYCLQFRNDKH